MAISLTKRNPPAIKTTFDHSMWICTVSYTIVPSHPITHTRLYSLFKGLVIEWSHQTDSLGRKLASTTCSNSSGTILLSLQVRNGLGNKGTAYFPVPARHTTRRTLYCWPQNFSVHWWMVVIFLYRYNTWLYVASFSFNRSLGNVISMPFKAGSIYIIIVSIRPR